MKATFRIPLVERLYKNRKGQKVTSGPWYKRVGYRRTKRYSKFAMIRTIDKRYAKQ